ncbi:MAG: hypothetical protein H7Y27_05225 [Gemmatimonadaceae bacterium]|nr:hypothetical protein [Chitinophagaceae bacterium]
MNQAKLFSIIMAAGMLAIGCDKDDDDYKNPPPPPPATSVVITAAGDSAGIVAKLNEFRTLAGDPNNGAPGATGGRREVNWDGVPPQFNNNNAFPFNFFGETDAALPNGRKRGLILLNTGNPFRVDSTDFSEIDASYATQFEPFTRKRLFITAGSTVTEVTFKVPGTNTNATVNSFACIFSDVDDANSTSIQYFSGNKLLGSFKAPVQSQGFSLLGVKFPNDKITLVKIISGNAPLAAGVKDISNGGTKDLVTMDDFLYDEPKANQ